MIDTDHKLQGFLAKIVADKTLIIDTEFRRIDSYYPQLCLVQIATKTAIECIDILALKSLKPLFDKLYQPDILWVVHSARQDIEALFCLSKKLPSQLFDTQIAANFLGHSGNISYQELTKNLQNIELAKAYTRLDWTIRPLPDEAIKYALDDVYYLRENYQKLKTMLTEKNRLDWAIEESSYLLDRKLYTINLSEIWQKVGGLSRLEKSAQTTAIFLSAWRETEAIYQNKPRKWIMTDKNIINYSQNQNADFKLKHKFTDFVQKNPEFAKIIIPKSQNRILTNDEKNHRKHLQNLIKTQAEAHNIPAEMLASNKSLLKYIRGDKSVNFCQGWRFNLLKNDLNQPA